MQKAKAIMQKSHSRGQEETCGYPQKDQWNKPAFAVMSVRKIQAVPGKDRGPRNIPVSFTDRKSSAECLSLKGLPVFHVSCGGPFFSFYYFS